MQLSKDLYSSVQDTTIIRFERGTNVETFSYSTARCVLWIEYTTLMITKTKGILSVQVKQPIPSS